MAPDLSIVVPLYNKEGEISRCIRSVLAQTFVNFELIVVDDGSTDSSAGLVEAIQDERIRLLSQANEGLSGTRNNGVTAARAPVVVFLDADDEWLPDHLQNIWQLVQWHPEAGIFFSAFWIDRGQDWRRRVRLGSSHLQRSSALVSDYFALPDGHILPSATAVRKAAMLQVGGYRRMFGEDIDLNMRMAASFPMAYSPRATAIWHVDAANRMCLDQDESKAPYLPGSLSASLKQISEADAVSAATKQHATQYLQRRELRAVSNLLMAGDKPQAAAVYAWWKKEFGARSSRIAFLLIQPSFILAAIQRARAFHERGHSVLSYVLHRRLSLRVTDLMRSGTSAA